MMICLFSLCVWLMAHPLLLPCCPCPLSAAPPALCCLLLPCTHHRHMQPAHGNGLGQLTPQQLPDGADQQPKQRKPYTLQKAREKWSDEEHNKFVEGLRLHGRQWRKIEGRSHHCHPHTHAPGRLLQLPPD